jgi:hypothetical protein
MSEFIQFQKSIYFTIIIISRCERGSNANEGFHSHANRAFGGHSISAHLLNKGLIVFTTAWNMNAAIENGVLDPSLKGCYRYEDIESIQTLSIQVTFSILTLFT